MPPAVNNPAEHVLQPEAPTSAYLLSVPHEIHLAPAPAYLPAAHGTTVLEPSHGVPDLHSSQLVRVVDVPPDVDEPTGHNRQLAAPANEYLLSSPHERHVAEPPGLYLPGVHATAVLLPSHRDPAAHAVHADNSEVPTGPDV